MQVCATATTHTHSTPKCMSTSDDHPQPAEALPLPLREGLDAWEQLIGKLGKLFADANVDAVWLDQFTETTRAVRKLANRDADLALYVLIESNGNSVERYSEKHSLVCMVIAELAADWLAWPEEEKQSLALAALSMNVSITSLQNAMAAQRTALTDIQRSQVQTHAQTSVEMLTKAGVLDPVWLYVVQHHHGAVGPEAATDTQAGPRLAELLRRVDIYTAKLSRRGSRGSVTPATAARDACLDASGNPDSIGATLLRVVGLYPPGTYVELANGETSIVVKRGKKAHAPIVASVRRSDWGLFSPPQRRDTELHGLAVKRGIEPGHAHVLFDHLRLLSRAR